MPNPGLRPPQAFRHSLGHGYVWNHPKGRIGANGCAAAVGIAACEVCGIRGKAATEVVTMFGAAGDNFVALMDGQRRWTCEDQWAGGTQIHLAP